MGKRHSGYFKYLELKLRELKDLRNLKELKRKIEMAYVKAYVFFIAASSQKACQYCTELLFGKEERSGFTSKLRMKSAHSVYC